jgi:hypothetical protein
LRLGDSLIELSSRRPRQRHERRLQLRPRIGVRGRLWRPPSALAFLSAAPEIALSARPELVEGYFFPRRLAEPKKRRPAPRDRPSFRRGCLKGRLLFALAEKLCKCEEQGDGCSFCIRPSPQPFDCLQAGAQGKLQPKAEGWGPFGLNMDASLRWHDERRGRGEGP